MFTFLNKKKGWRSGFTLIELLVVIAIIGVLASIVLASLNNARRKSRDARRVTDVKQLQLALELYFDSVGQYPATLSLTVPLYIPVEPKDPIGVAVSYPYFPLLTSAGTACGAGVCLYYHIGANLEDQTTAGITSDADRCDPVATGCTVLTGTGIDGQDGVANNTGCLLSAGSNRWCYDLTP